jgi:hypothetical protein
MIVQRNGKLYPASPVKKKPRESKRIMTPKEHTKESKSSPGTVKRNTCACTIWKDSPIWNTATTHGLCALSTASMGQREARQCILLTFALWRGCRALSIVSQQTQLRNATLREQRILQTRRTLSRLCRCTVCARNHCSTARSDSFKRAYLQTLRSTQASLLLVVLVHADVPVAL